MKNIDEVLESKYIDKQCCWFIQPWDYDELNFENFTIEKWAEKIGYKAPRFFYNPETNRFYADRVERAIKEAYKLREFFKAEVKWIFKTLSIEEKSNEG